MSLLCSHTDTSLIFPKIDEDREGSPCPALKYSLHNILKVSKGKGYDDGCE